jgi:hypothetical protein
MKFRPRRPLAAERKEMTTEEQLDQLTAIVESLAARVVARNDQIESHNRQIEGLIKVAHKEALGRHG